MPAALSDEQRRTLYRDGFVVVPNQIPPELIAAARRAIYRNIGRANNSALNFASDPARSVRNSTRGDGLEGGEEGLQRDCPGRGAQDQGPGGRRSGAGHGPILARQGGIDQGPRHQIRP